MTRAPQFEDVLGPLAAAILREVMARGEVSVADVVAGLRATHDREHAYTTVMTVMGRLYERGLLERRRRGRQYIYAGSASEPALLDRLTAVAVDRVIERYGTAALRHFAVKLADLEPETLRLLTALVEEPE